MSVSAAAPRTAAPSPNSEARTSQPDHADERTRSSSTLRTSSTSHGASGPKQPPSTTTSTSKRLTTEPSPRPRYRPASARLADHGLVASSARRTSSAVMLWRTAAGADRDAGPRGDRLEPDERLEAAGGAALAGGPVGSTVMWPNSPPKPCEPRKSSPSMKMPPPTPTSPNTQTKFSASRATPCQCSASAARFDSFSARTAMSGRPGSRVGDLVGDEDLRPAEVRRPEQRSRLGLDDAGERNGDACRDQPHLRDRGERLGRHAAEAVQDG